MYTITWIRKYYGESFTSPQPTEIVTQHSTKDQAKDHLRNLANSALNIQKMLGKNNWANISLSDNNEILRMVFSPNTEEEIIHIYTIVED